MMESSWQVPVSTRGSGQGGPLPSGLMETKRRAEEAGVYGPVHVSDGYSL